MKKSARRILSLIMAIALILSLSGCNSTKQGAVFVRFLYTDHLYSVMPKDIENIKSELKAKLPETNNTVIPVYSFLGGIIGESEGFDSVNTQVYSKSVLVNDTDLVSVLAIEEKYAHLLGLGEMADDTAYFLDYGDETIEIEDTGITLRTETTVSANGLYSLIKSEYIDSGEIEGPVCFINMETMDKIVAVLSAKLTDKEYPSTSLAAEEYHTACIAATVIITDNVPDTRKVLSELNYKCSAEYE